MQQVLISDVNMVIGLTYSTCGWFVV